MLLVNRQKLDDPKKDKKFNVFSLLRRLSGDKKLLEGDREAPRKPFSTSEKHSSFLAASSKFPPVEEVTGPESDFPQHHNSLNGVDDDPVPASDSTEGNSTPGLSLFSRNNSFNTNLHTINYSFSSNYTTGKHANSSSLSPISPIATSKIPHIMTTHAPSITDNCNHITIVQSHDDSNNIERCPSFVTDCISLQNSEMTNDEEKQLKFFDNFQKLFSKPPSYKNGGHETDSAQIEENDDVINSILEEDEHFDPNQEESLLDYKYGGYHPVCKGDIYQSSNTKLNYLIIRKLGWGHFSTVWLARAIDSNSYVAIKFVKSNQNYLEAAEDEIKILHSLQHPLESNHLTNQFKQYFNNSPSSHPGHKNIMELVDDFEINGPNGNHICMVFELLGENMLNLLYKYKQKATAIPKTLAPAPSSLVAPAASSLLAVPLPLVKQIVRQLLSGLDYMHHCGIIHTDLKPENILIKLNDPETLIEQDYGCSSKKLLQKFTSCSTTSSTSSASSSTSSCPISCSKPLCDNSSKKGKISIKIADLGNATYSHIHFTNQIQTRQYRSPEIILKHKSWGASTDLWSVGCIIFELITGDYLFDPHDGKSFSKDDDHLAQIIELLGEYPPDEFLLNCKLTPKFFKIDQNNNMVLKKIDNLKFWSLENVFIEKYKFQPGPEVKLMADLIRKCLSYNLQDRYNAASLSNHPWLRTDFDVSNATDEIINQELEKMSNDYHDIPGYTSTWGDEDSEYE